MVALAHTHSLSSRPRWTLRCLLLSTIALACLSIYDIKPREVSNVREPLSSRPSGNRGTWRSDAGKGNGPPRSGQNKGKDMKFKEQSKRSKRTKKPSRIELVKRGLAGTFLSVTGGAAKAAEVETRLPNIGTWTNDNVRGTTRLKSTTNLTGLKHHPTAKDSTTQGFLIPGEQGEREIGSWFLRLPKSQVIPAQDLMNIFGLPRDFYEKYDLDSRNVLGEGAYGTVFTAIRREDKTPVAVKVLYKKIHKKKQRPADARYLCRLKNELTMMQKMGKGTHAVQYMEAFEDENNIYLVMELCKGPTLKHFIRQKGVNEKTACVIMSQVLRMLSDWHREGFMHCDMKPANLLLTNSEEDRIHIKATDFGLAHEFTPGQVHRKKQGTKVYMAPEMLEKQYCEKADMWSVGIIAYQLLAGRLPFCKHDSEVRKLGQPELESRILTCDIDVTSSPTWDNISLEARDFILKVLERNPSRRLSAEEALDHPWFSSLSKGQSRNTKRVKYRSDGSSRIGA